MTHNRHSKTEQITREVVLSVASKQVSVVLQREVLGQAKEQISH